MSEGEWHRGPRCGIDNCKSSSYQVTDGLTYCRNGHQRQGVIQTELEENVPGSQGQTTRAKRERKEKVHRAYVGQQAFELFLQSYQFILWKQCYILVHEKDFPRELEIVVHDLWALRLRILEEKHGLRPDSEREAKVYSSQTETTGTEDEAELDRPGRSRAEKDLPGLIDTLGLCYMGMMLLRLPVSMAALNLWAVTQEIPFIRAIRYLPRVMKLRLPVYYQNILDTQSPLVPDDLINGISQLFALYYRNFELIIPPLNYPPVLYRYVQDLTLPLNLYTSTQALASILSIHFSFPTPKYRRSSIALPEIQLVALLVITVKLYHPFDDLERHVKSTSDGGFLAIDWDVWSHAHQVHDTATKSDRPFAPGSEINLTEHDVMIMSDVQADAYMDWYEKTWIEKDVKDTTTRSLPQELLDMFPTGRQDRSTPSAPPTSEERRIKERDTMTARFKTVLGSLKARKVVPGEEEGHHANVGARVGAHYTHYRRMEDLEGHAKVFHEVVARMAGIQVKTLLGAVFGMEMRLRRWREDQLRTELGENGEEMEDDIFVCLEST